MEAFNKPEGAVKGEKKPTWQENLRPWITVIYVLLLLGVVSVCFWNIMPYQVAVSWALSRFDGITMIGQFLQNNPIFVWIGAGIIGFAAWKLSEEWIAGLAFAFLVLALAFSPLYEWIIAAIVWAVIQAIELLPIVMGENPGYIRTILNEKDAHKNLQIKGDDDGLTKSLKKGYNALPMRFIATARRLRVWVYLLDLVICLAVYPPVSVGGIDRLFYVMTAGLWGLLDWGNIVMLFATLFAVEAVFKLLLISRNFLKYLKQAEAKPA